MDQCVRDAREALLRALPNEGDRIRYRVKTPDGEWRNGESTVSTVWAYDDEPILTLTDGTRVLPTFGDTWEAIDANRS
jgi:hypothetical protein